MSFVTEGRNFEDAIAFFKRINQSLHLLAVEEIRVPPTWSVVDNDVLSCVFLNKNRAFHICFYLTDESVRCLRKIESRISITVQRWLEEAVMGR